MLALGLGLELEFEQELEVELELVAGQVDTGCLASKAGRAALESELELELGPGLWLWQVQGLVLWFELGLGLTLVQGQEMEPVVSQASMVCWAGQSSMVQAEWPVRAMRGTQLRTAAGWAKCC